MSKIKNGALDQYGADAFEQQQFGTAGSEGVKLPHLGAKRMASTTVPNDGRLPCRCNTTASAAFHVV